MCIFFFIYQTLSLHKIFWIKIILKIACVECEDSSYVFVSKVHITLCVHIIVHKIHRYLLIEVENHKPVAILNINGFYGMLTTCQITIPFLKKLNWDTKSGPL
jgi:hypothetical protein